MGRYFLDEKGKGEDCYEILTQTTECGWCLIIGIVSFDPDMPVYMGSSSLDYLALH